MLGLNPYLIFDGQCEEALKYYRDKLDAELISKNRFSEGPLDVPESARNRIMHSVFRIADSIVMASDNMPDQTTKQGENVVLSLTLEDLDKARKYYEVLSGDGKSIMPFEKTFWGSTFGYARDKFGIFWMISCEHNQDES